MRRKRRTHSPEFKAKVALAAIQGVLTMAEVDKKIDVHANQVADWLGPKIDVEPKELLAGMVPAQLGRHIQPIEVGRVVAFLLSLHATIIRGQAINVDGGDTPY